MSSAPNSAAGYRWRWTVRELVIAGGCGGRIGVVAGSTGRFHGVPVTAGGVCTVAGNGANGFSGDGGPAGRAEPGGVAMVVAGAGGSLIAGFLRPGLEGDWPTKLWR